MRSLLLLLAVLTLSLWPGRAADAFPGESDGWGGVRWGDSAKTLMKRRPGIRKKGYRLGNVQASLRRSEGGIFLDESTATYGQDEAGIRWFVRKGQGVFKVEISLEDSNPMTSLSGKGIRGVIEAAHGPGGRDRERRGVWPGKKTVIEVNAPRMLTGAHVIVTHTRRSEWEGDEAQLSLPDGWGADEPAADAPKGPAKASAPAPQPTPPAASESELPATGKAPSAMERSKREAARRLEASKKATAAKKASDKAAAESRALPEIDEAEGLLDPSVE